MSKPQKSKSRLGRGLSSLISMSDPSSFDEAMPESPPTDNDPMSTGTDFSQMSAPSKNQNGIHEENSTKLSGHESKFPTEPGGNQHVQPPFALGRPTSLPINDILPNPNQPRRQFNETSLHELAASLKTTGMIQPVIVRPHEGRYQLVAGERRWRAAKLAGLEVVPALVREVDALTQAQMALIENIQREDLNPMDRALGYRLLIDQLGLTQAELAGRLGEDRSSVANFLRLLDLAEPVRELVQQGKLSTGHAKILAGVTDVQEQIRLAQRVIAETLSVRNLERILQEAAPVKITRIAKGLSPHLEDLQKSIRRQLGMRVDVKAVADKPKGKLVIHYTTLDEFDQLLERLGIKVEE